jgi:glycosyltransferase involved in cell wall biosynthesis
VEHREKYEMFRIIRGRGMNKKKIDLTLVVPCLNEVKIIEDSISEIKKILDKNHIIYEIIFVDDGSTDGTREIIMKISKENKNFRYILHNKNEGRGKSVTDGIKEARGGIVGFIDIDLEIPAEYIIPLALGIKNGMDITTAQRIYKLKTTSLLRYILHEGYACLVKLLLKTKLRDTETGCKFFSKSRILPIIVETKDKHWFWDTEVMVRSYYKGLKIKEIPAFYERRNNVKSTVNIFKDTIYYFVRLLKFRRELKHQGII